MRNGPDLVSPFVADAQAATSPASEVVGSATSSSGPTAPQLAILQNQVRLVRAVEPSKTTDGKASSPDDEGNDGDSNGEEPAAEPRDEAEFLNVLEDRKEQAPTPPGPSDGNRVGEPMEPPNGDRPVPRAEVGLQRAPELKLGDDPTKMHVDDVDVRKVLEMLARSHALNILVSPKVTGRVTADLSNLTLEQMLDAILKSCNLIARNEDGVIYVYTPEELKLRNVGSGNKDDAIGFRVYQLNYTRSTDLQKILKPFLSSEGKMTGTTASQVGIRPINPISGQASNGSGGGGGGAGGGNGQSMSGGDSLANQEAIVIEDRKSVLVKIDRIIEQLDVQPSQVLIEAVILYVTHDNSCELGVNFGVVDGAGNVLGVMGNGATLNTAAGFSPLSVLIGGLVRGGVPPTAGASGAGSSASTGPSNTGFATDDHGLKVGNTSKHLTSFIKALEHIGKVEVLATPRLLVLNKQLAELQLGDRLGYSTLSQSIVSTTQQIQFMNVGTLLRVRPFISSDGMVRMEVHPERSTGAIINNIPQASTAEVTTNVMVPDGATLVIGGLMDNQVEFDQDGIPWLNRLPVIGALFRDRLQKKTKKELVVMLTTHIWNSKTGSSVEMSNGIPSQGFPSQETERFPPEELPLPR